MGFSGRTWHVHAGIRERLLNSRQAGQEAGGDGGTELWQKCPKPWCFISVSTAEAAQAGMQKHASRLPTTEQEDEPRCHVSFTVNPEFSWIEIIQCEAAHKHRSKMSYYIKTLMTSFFSSNSPELRKVHHILHCLCYCYLEEQCAEMKSHGT